MLGCRSLESTRISSMKACFFLWMPPLPINPLTRLDVVFRTWWDCKRWPFSPFSGLFEAWRALSGWVPPLLVFPDSRSTLCIDSVALFSWGRWSIVSRWYNHWIDGINRTVPHRRPKDKAVFSVTSFRGWRKHTLNCHFGSPILSLQNKSKRTMSKYFGWIVKLEIGLLHHPQTICLPLLFLYKKKQNNRPDDQNGC